MNTVTYVLDHCLMDTKEYIPFIPLVKRMSQLCLIHSFTYYVISKYYDIKIITIIFII